MTVEPDFERRWQAKLSAYIDEVAGPEVRARVTAGGEFLTDASDRDDIIRWSADAIGRLSHLVEAPVLRGIMTRCACHYPAPDLQPIRKHYAETHNIRSAHDLLQEQFKAFLRGVMGLEEEVVAEIVSRGWGSAGVLDGHTIIATKIPKSGYLREYLAEPSRERRRELYCHCPRVRDATRLGIPLPTDYCYCGAGFYKDIWETIIGQPVEVELLDSIVMGGEVCRVAVHLPDHV